MAHKNGRVIINTTQRTQKFLRPTQQDFYVYLQFGKGKKNKKRPRVVVNWVKGLKKTRNKPLQQELLQDAGIKVPQYFGMNHHSACQWMRDNGGKIVGKRKNHSRGRGIKLFDSPEDLMTFGERNINRYYYQTFHDMNREWRIHVSAYQNEPVVAYRKCFLGETVEAYKNGDIEKPWVRNLENCYFKLDGVERDKEPWFDDMVAECKRAIEVLDMDIAGVDIGENNKVDGGDFVIYEVNSACGMEEHTRTCYEEAIDRIVEAKARKKGLL